MKGKRGKISNNYLLYIQYNYQSYVDSRPLGILNILKFFPISEDIGSTLCRIKTKLYWREIDVKVNDILIS